MEISILKCKLFDRSLKPMVTAFNVAKCRPFSVTALYQQRTIAINVRKQNIDNSKNKDHIPGKFDANDYKTAFKNRKLSEIIRALFIFKMCTYETLVRNSLTLMTVSKKILGSRLYTRCMKATIYNQFVAGETEEELTVAVSKLRERSMGPMLFVPMEEDAGQAMSREDWYNKNLETILGCIRLAKEIDPMFPMSQMKLTAVVPGDLCVIISEKWSDPHASIDVLDHLVDGLKGSTVHIDGLDKNKLADLNMSLARMKVIGEEAERLGVRLLIDAEYTYMNPALRILSLAMMLQYNLDRPVVAYTYQNYLKKTFKELQQDCQFIRSRGACFATKLVRGAYMHKERQMAKEQCYEDPVHPTFDNTSAMYNQSMEFCLDAVKQEPDKLYMVIASHNEGTVQHAVQEIDKRVLSLVSGEIFFGQIYGMSDYLSSALGHGGFVVYKSTPYGPVDETIPYLYRRALENSSVLGGTQKERQMLWKAFVDRITFGKFPKKSENTRVVRSNN